MANEKILNEKKQIVADLTERIKGATSGVFVQYTGITVSEDTALRSELRKNEVEYSVVKNTLTRRAVKEAGYEGLDDIFNGATAMATTEDFTAAARVLCEYAEKNDKFIIKAGFVAGETLDADGVKALAKIPSKPVLYAKFLGSIQSPLYSFAYAIQAIIDKNGEGAAEEAAEA